MSRDQRIKWYENPFYQFPISFLKTVLDLMQYIIIHFGPMGSGKTTAAIGKMKRLEEAAILAKNGAAIDGELASVEPGTVVTRVFSPEKDTRTKITHGGKGYEPVEFPSDDPLFILDYLIKNNLLPGPDVSYTEFDKYPLKGFAIDEVNFVSAEYTDELATVITYAASRGIFVAVSGLARTFDGELFGVTPDLITRFPSKQHFAICPKCGTHSATETLRLDSSKKTVVVGKLGTDYIPLCTYHYYKARTSKVFVEKLISDSSEKLKIPTLK